MKILSNVLLAWKTSATVRYFKHFSDHLFSESTLLTISCLPLSMYLMQPVNSSLSSNFKQLRIHFRSCEFLIAVFQDCLLHCALSLAAQCIVIGPVCLCVGVFVCRFVCGSVTTITRNCVHRSSPNCIVSIGGVSDYLQPIKFWPSCTPGKGVCGGAKFFDSALLQPARSVCVCLSAFFHLFIYLDRNAAPHTQVGLWS